MRGAAICVSVGGAELVAEFASAVFGRIQRAYGKGPRRRLPWDSMAACGGAALAGHALAQQGRRFVERRAARTRAGRRCLRRQRMRLFARQAMSSGIGHMASRK